VLLNNNLFARLNEESPPTMRAAAQIHPGNHRRGLLTEGCENCIYSPEVSKKTYA
jgi:hypothetical protein